MRGRTILTTALVLVGLNCFVQTHASVASAECPISFSRLDLPYDHSGGSSSPMAIATFTNQTGKQLVRARFSLTILDEHGSEHPYAHSLDYPRMLDAGKQATGKWHLNSEDIDMHRTGEIIFVTSVEFEDASTWMDDGNFRCRYEVNYRAK